MNYEEIEYLRAYPKEFLYPIGLPFDEKLAENIDDLMSRVNNGKASLIIIDGGVGEGKTTLGVQIGEYAQKKTLEFDKQLSMGGGEFMKKAEACYNNGLHVLIYDEAGDFNRRGSLKSFNAMINRFFETYRAYKILVIICVPDFNVLDQQLFRNKIPRLLLHLYNRKRTFGNYRAYSLYRMFYIKNKMLKGIVPSWAFMSTEPNFYGHNKNLPPERADELAKISTASKLNTLKDSRRQLEGLMSIEDLARKLKLESSGVRKTIKELNIDYVDKRGRTFLFPKETLDDLKHHLAIKRGKR